jgi:hypothetical protein
MWRYAGVWRRLPKHSLLFLIWGGSVRAPSATSWVLMQSYIKKYIQKCDFCNQQDKSTVMMGKEGSAVQLTLTRAEAAGWKITWRRVDSTYQIQWFTGRISDVGYSRVTAEKRQPPTLITQKCQTKKLHENTMKNQTLKKRRNSWMISIPKIDISWRHFQRLK